MKVIEGMKAHYAAEKYQIEAYAWLAVAMAPRDKARTATLIENALERAGRSTGRISKLDRISAAAPVRPPGPRRARSGPGMTTWRPRSFACWQHGRRAGTAIRRRKLECETVAAAILALTDPKAASQMLRDLELRWGQRLGRAWQDCGPPLADGVGTCRSDARRAAFRVPNWPRSRAGPMQTWARPGCSRWSRFWCSRQSAGRSFSVGRSGRRGILGSVSRACATFSFARQAIFRVSGIAGTDLKRTDKVGARAARRPDPRRRSRGRTDAEQRRR